MGATASLKGSARFATFAAGKFAKRAIAQSLAREFGPKVMNYSSLPPSLPHPDYMVSWYLTVFNDEIFRVSILPMSSSTA